MKDLAAATVLVSLVTACLFALLVSRAHDRHDRAEFTTYTMPSR